MKNAGTIKRKRSPMERIDDGMMRQRTRLEQIDQRIAAAQAERNRVLVKLMDLYHQLREADR